MFPFTISIQHCTGVSNKYNKARKRKDIQNGKEIKLLYSEITRKSDEVLKIKKPNRTSKLA